MPGHKKDRPPRKPRPLGQPWPKNAPASDEKQRSGNHNPGDRVGAPAILELTPQIAVEIAAAMRTGCSRLIASEAAGISSSTLTTWLERGAAATEGVYYDFARTVLSAKAFAARQALQRLDVAAAQGDTKVSMWLLARLFPAEFGDRIAVDASHTGMVAHVGLTAADVRNFSDEDLDDLERIGGRLLGAASGGDAKPAGAHPGGESTS